jgi:hypothetical protein
MARPAGSKNTKPRELDPLLQAVIARLPPSNTAWPIAARAAWLELVERAFDMVYPAEPLNGGSRGGGSGVKPNGHAVPAAPDHAFYIDRENYARMSGGERINAIEVDGSLFDLRGEGDLGAIIWADGSTGVLGKVLDIKPA